MQWIFTTFALELGVDIEAARARRRPGETEYLAAAAVPPDPAFLRAQLSALGFVLITDVAHGDSGMFSLVGYRGAETIAIHFTGAQFGSQLFANAANRDAFPHVEIEHGTFRWDGETWPAPFLDGTITSEDADGIIVEARLDDPAHAVANLRAWSLRHGYAIESGLHATRGLRFESAQHRVHAAIDEDGELTLFISRR